MKTKRIPESKWEWHGFAAHFCCGEWCRFHMATKIGAHLISTVGKYVHPRNSGASELTERNWLLENPEGEQIGYGRTYETMVFKAGAPCSSGCGIPSIDGSELDSLAANDSKTARQNHMQLCNKFARK